MVSLKRYRHMQLINKRMSSKMAYYQTVIRRDRAIISTLKSELLKYGRSIDCSHLKIPNFRLKYINNPMDDVIQGLDSQEQEAYSRVLKGQKLDCLKFKSWKKDESLPKFKTVNISDPLCIKIENSEQPLACESNDNKSYATKNQFETCVVKLEKAVVSNPDKSISVKVKKQIAVKSSKGGLKFYQNKHSAPCTNDLVDDKSKVFNVIAPNTSSCSTTRVLQEKAIQEGKAFAQLKAKCTTPLNTKFSKPGPKSSKKFYQHGGKRQAIANLTHTVSRDAIPSFKRSPELYAPKIKKKTYKKIKKELQDDVYVPSVPIDLRDSFNTGDLERDNELFDILQQYAEEDQTDALIGVSDPSSITSELRQLILLFVTETNAYDRLVYGSGDTTSEEESLTDADMDVDKISNSKRFSLCEDNTQSESSITSSSTATTRDQFIGLLYKRFLATHKQRCTLKIFIECLPKTMVRRSAISRGYTNCLLCGQTELKFETLVNQGLLDFKSDFEDVWIDKELKSIMYASLDAVMCTNMSIPHSTWAKSYKGNNSKSVKTVTDTVSSVVNGLKKDLSAMEVHMDRVVTKYHVIRGALSRCQENSNEALVHVAWSENPKVFHRSINNQTVADQCISLLSGYVWTGDREYSFSCLSDIRDHSTASLWAHLDDPLSDLVMEGYTKLFIVSDPTVGQFRNKVHFYYMNEFAVKQNVEIRWIYSPGYHTHMKGDLYAHKTREIIEKTSLSLVKKDGDNPYRSAHSVIEMLRDVSSGQFYFVRSEEVLQKTADLPQLQGIKGTQTFAEILIGPGKFLVKLDSMDEYWTKVLIIF